MVYRFKPSERKYKIREKKPYRRAGADSPKRLYGYRQDEIDLSVLFELSKLEGKKKKSSARETFARLFGSFKKSAKSVAKGFKRSIGELHRLLVSAFFFLSSDQRCPITSVVSKRN